MPSNGKKSLAHFRECGFGRLVGAENLLEHPAWLERQHEGARAAALPEDMRGRAADDEDRLAREREFPHRVIDLLGYVGRPGTLVDAGQLIEREPQFPVIGIDRLNRSWPGEQQQRRIGAVRAALGDEQRELLAENLDIERVEKQIAQLILTIARNAEDAGKRSGLAAHLRFEFGKQDTLCQLLTAKLGATSLFLKYKRDILTPSGFNAIVRTINLLLIISGPAIPGSDISSRMPMRAP